MPVCEIDANRPMYWPLSAATPPPSSSPRARPYFSPGTNSFWVRAPKLTASHGRHGLFPDPSRFGRDHWAGSPVGFMATPFADMIRALRLASSWMEAVMTANGSAYERSANCIIRYDDAPAGADHLNLHHA